MSLPELQQAMVRLCFDPAPDARDVETLGGEAVLLYRELVRSRLHELVGLVLPRSAGVLGPERTAALVDGFLATDPPRSRYLRDVIPAFVAHALPRLGEGAPRHAADVMRLESARWEIGWRPARVEGAVGPPSLERALVPHPTLRLLRLDHALRDGEIAPALPGASHACLHRRDDHLVETRPLDATSARLVAGWMRSERPAIEEARAVLAEEGREADAAFVDRMSSLLAALLESRAFLGSRP